MIPAACNRTPYKTSPRISLGDEVLFNSLVSTAEDFGLRNQLGIKSKTANADHCKGCECANKLVEPAIQLRTHGPRRPERKSALADGDL